MDDGEKGEGVLAEPGCTCVLAWHALGQWQRGLPWRQRPLAADAIAAPLQCWPTLAAPLHTHPDTALPLMLSPPLCSGCI